MIWLLLTLLACGEPATDDTAPPAVDCEGLDEEACEAAAGCVPTSGLSIHGDHDCEDLGPNTFAGCRTRPDGDPPCAAVPIQRAPPDAPDPCWWFGGACSPDGWVQCDPLAECAGD